ncbi:hypothetical protein AWE51_10600 [Aquimarina aggregata]|uniref:YcaO domain-containing protein n=1 Tax=Aquimarina aggregata TaxID=1642818 RepID=A0A162Y9K6_9FLAO|nr:TOMM precursor leader peptide-binding protein [Aquimarina aggregata]KZS39008.1 hypothetical protein AWE51_10600 [Aquimarina aggregata]
MPDTFYRIKEKYTKVNVNDHYTIMTSERDSVVLQSPLAIQLLEKISGEKITKDFIVANYEHYSSNLSDVIITLHQLESEGYITQSKPYFTPEQTAYWEESGYDTNTLSTIFKNKSIAVRALGSVDTMMFNDACRNVGIEFSETPTLIVVLTTDYLHPDLESVNQEMLDHQIPWLLLKLNGTTPYIGPLILPDNADSACWACLQHRLALHDQESKLYQALAKTNHTIARPVINHPLAQQWGISVALSELVSWMYHDHNDQLFNHLIAINTKTRKQSTHRVVKRPQCRACGTKEVLSQHPSPIDLKKEDILSDHLGGYRTVPPEVTLEKYMHHVSDITGVVPYLRAYHPVEDAPIYNFGSGKNMALQSSSLFWLNLHLRSANGGKGKTEIQAKTGALCEAIERYSLMYQGEAYKVQAAFKDLDVKIHPNQCMLYSNAQYQDRERINNESTKFYSLIPIAFDTDEVMDWTPVYSLTHKEFKFLPSCYCYAQYPAKDEKRLYAYPDSNGCAAGNTIEEAILQGFLELVERDAAAIWWYNRIQYPEVALETAGNEYVNKMMRYYKDINRSLYVLDITTDLEIPVFVAISHSIKEDEKDKVLYAFGAHVDANIALERAIIELNQLLPVVINDKKDYLTTDKVFIDWLNNATLKDNTYLIPLDKEKKNMQADYAKLCPATVYDSLQFCIEKAKKQGLETLALDLTQPDIGLSVAKVIVPGLRHFWRRTAPGRLYDVPVKMGKFKEPLTEEELNPLSIFI